MVFGEQDFNVRDAAVQPRRLMVAETSTLILIAEIIIFYMNLHQINIYSVLRQYRRYHSSYDKSLIKTFFCGKLSILESACILCHGTCVYHSRFWPFCGYLGPFRTFAAICSKVYGYLNFHIIDSHNL